MGTTTQEQKRLKKWGTPTPPKKEAKKSFGGSDS